MRTHGFGQLAAFFVAHVSRRRTDQAAHAMLFHVFAHVDTHECGFTVKQFGRKRTGQFRLADTRGAQEQEASNRRIFAA